MRCVFLALLVLVHEHKQKVCDLCVAICCNIIDTTFFFLLLAAGIHEAALRSKVPGRAEQEDHGWSVSEDVTPCLCCCCFCEL